MSASAVQHAIAQVDDPEYPGVSIVDLGLLEAVEITGSHVAVDLIPTFSGCPALEMIRADVEAAALAVAGVTTAAVRFLNSPVWTPARINEAGRAALAEQFTVAVQIGTTPPECPRCGTPTDEKAMFGPTRCRSVHRCPNCNEVVEVIR